MYRCTSNHSSRFFSANYSAGHTGHAHADGLGRQMRLGACLIAPALKRINNLYVSVAHSIHSFFIIITITIPLIPCWYRTWWYCVVGGGGGGGGGSEAFITTALDTRHGSPHHVSSTKPTAAAAVCFFFLNSEMIVDRPNSFLLSSLLLCIRE